MQVDIVGRINNLQLPRTQPYIPLFECLVNSIEAMANLPDSSPRRIDVNIEHDIRQQGFKGIEDAASSIQNITITDTGVGFNDANYQAFFLSDSTNKVSNGNKGIGRFTWLKVFEKASVFSTYSDDTEWFQRSFDFLKTKSGVENENISESKSNRYQTIVSLSSLRTEYQKHFPKNLETISRKIIDHLLIYFVSGNCPSIWLHDNLGSSALSVNDMFADEIRSSVTEIPFMVKEWPFMARIVKYHSSTAKQHSVSYCAHQREVRAQKASSLVSDLTVKLLDDDDESFVFLTYISGLYLDENVNSERTDFLFMRDDESDLIEELSKQELYKAVGDQIRSVAAPYLATLKVEKIRNVEQFVANKGPEYRFILNERYETHLDSVPPHLTDDALDLALFKVQREIEVEHREKAKQISTLSTNAVTDSDQYKALYDRYIQEENELGKAALAKYVIHRRTILDLLDKALVFQDDGRYAKEELVHKLIFPMRVTSDDVAFSEQNLWVIDERLAFHIHLGSDVSLKKLKVVNLNDSDEPDIVVFNALTAFSESEQAFQSIVLVEFKRPERNEYPSKDEDPVEQILRYVRKIKDGEAKSIKGKTINGQKIPFYAYIICSLTPKIRQIAADRDFTPTADNEGYFSFHKNSGCYIEILSYDKMLNDAKKRNRAFFDKLQIPFN
ncbi:ATP-binding protein [Solimicrobium silvestre]|uniref:Histidine kinase-, DNA gyrase B-, and HSP90-like ATPase n=1 Tax=Solimicrobium silvestre TaxID=2099400 RepID=A0A2S9H2X4_9BURK|nr:ATP-binding protein [Solimicrobium silvestre]PRC94335.1 Histidine kinase-, DNA gyrase B-, and HSP90-like ATPase [Solimicrobium silvestre]